MDADEVTLFSRVQNIISDGLVADPNARPAPGSLMLSDFKRMMYPTYIHLFYQAVLDSYLERVEEYIRTGGQSGIARLMVFMPPRHGKTMTVSRFFPAWFMGRNPDKRLIMASYGQTLANRNSRAVRNMIHSRRFMDQFPGVTLSQDTASVHEWDIAGRDGGGIASGVGGSIGGFGAHLFVIDDPIKNRAQAESKTYRERLQEWYGDAFTRLEEPGAAIILMHTRWHEEDLAGYLLNEEPGEWTVLRLPALAEGDDILGRQIGAALWPERFDVAKLEKRRDTLGEYRFTSEYQQLPRPKEGGLFDTEMITILDDEPKCKRIWRFYDLAVTRKRRSDFTVGLKLGEMEAGQENFVILDVWRVQKELPDVQEGIVQNAMMDGKRVRIRLEAEKAGIVELQYLSRDKRMRPFTMDMLPPVGDKYTRAGPVATRVNTGRVKMVRGAWNRRFLDELAMFPASEHDDQVDALSGAYEAITKNAGVTLDDIARLAKNKVKGDESVEPVLKGGTPL